MTGVYVPGSTRLDSNTAIYSTDTFINQGSGTIGCRGLGAWQIQSTNYNVTANTSHSITVTYFTGGTWGALPQAYLTINIYNTSTSELTGIGLLITPSTPNGSYFTQTFTPLPGVTYKVFGAITWGEFAPEPVCRPYHANSGTVYFDSYTGGEPYLPQGHASSTTACNVGSGGYNNTIYYNGTFGDGTVLYRNSYSNDAWDNNGGWFFKDGYSFQLDGSTVYNYTECLTGYDFYYADSYYCEFPCGLEAYGQIVAFPAGSYVQNYKWYAWSGGTNSYRITGTAYDPHVVVPLLGTDMSGYNSCDVACYGV